LRERCETIRLQRLEKLDLEKKEKMGKRVSKLERRGEIESP